MSRPSSSQSASRKEVVSCCARSFSQDSRTYLPYGGNKDASQGRRQLLRLPEGLISMDGLKTDAVVEYPHDPAHLDRRSNRNASHTAAGSESVPRFSEFGGGAYGISLWYAIPKWGGLKQYSFYEKRLGEIPNAGSGFDPLPKCLTRLWKEVKDKLELKIKNQPPVKLLAGFALFHAQTTKMVKGCAHLSSHVDTPKYGEIIVTAVLRGSSVVKVDRTDLKLRAGQGYAMFGKVRAVLKHGVEPPNCVEPQADSGGHGSSSGSSSSSHSGDGSTSSSASAEAAQSSAPGDAERIAVTFRALPARRRALLTRSGSANFDLSSSRRRAHRSGRKGPTKYSATIRRLLRNIGLMV